MMSINIRVMAALVNYLICFVLYTIFVFLFFFFNDTATTEIYTLSLHDALPISWSCGSVQASALLPRVSRSGLTTRTFSDRKSTRLNSSHLVISYAVFCLKKKKNIDSFMSRYTDNTYQLIRLIYSYI